MLFRNRDSRNGSIVPVDPIRCSEPEVEGYLDFDDPSVPNGLQEFSNE